MSKVRVIFVILLNFLLLFSMSYCFSQENMSAGDYVDLANYSIEKGAYVLAFGYFKKAIEINSSYLPAIEVLNKISEAVSKMSEQDASELVNAALKEYPEYSDLIHWGLSFIYQAQGFNQKALAESDKIKDKERLSPYSPDLFYVVRANAYTGLGEISQAQQELEGALQFFPDSVALHSSIANVYSLNQEIQKAIFHYQKVLELKPDIENAEQIRQQIESLKRTINDFE